jgi:hypothetical protein
MTLKLYANAKTPLKYFIVQVSFSKKLARKTSLNAANNFQAVNKEMLGRGRVDALVKENFDFEDW